jgi:hypothetical protein
VLDDAFFKAVRARGAEFLAHLRDSFVAVMEQAATDSRYVLADQLGFWMPKCERSRHSTIAKYKMPKELLAALNRPHR